jgi:hypothetical protein
MRTRLYKFLPNGCFKTYSHLKCQQCKQSWDTDSFSILFGELTRHRLSSNSLESVSYRHLLILENMKSMSKPVMVYTSISIESLTRRKPWRIWKMTVLVKYSSCKLLYSLFSNNFRLKNCQFPLANFRDENKSPNIETTNIISLCHMPESM